MEELMNQIEKALENKLFYLALYITLTIPDTCAALESEDGKTTGARYAAWFDKYLAKEYGDFTGRDCWAFRCAMLHQGKANFEGRKFSRVIFVYPNSSLFCHKNTINDAYNIDIKSFCEDIINATISFCKEKMNTEPFESNCKGLIRIYPSGIPPYITGIPVIG